MPVPFEEPAELDALGTAAYLRILPQPEHSMRRGALFLVNGRGEPVEFSYNQAEARHSFLWRGPDLDRFIARKLAASLLRVCTRTPSLLMCLADEVQSDLFCDDLTLSVPVCRIAPRIATVAFSPREHDESLDGTEPLHLFWYPGSPSEESSERRLVNALVKRGLLLEPFERIRAGLKEVYEGHQTTQ